MKTLSEFDGFVWNKAIKIEDNIYRLGVNIEDEDYLFEGLWHIPDGTSINAYVIKTSKGITVIDLTQVLQDFPERYETQLAEIGIRIEDIDNVIVLHLEPDHAGYLPILMHKNSKAKFYCTPKASPGAQAFAGIPVERIVEVADADTLDLGDGHVLQFFHTPNVHWPETMVAHEQKSKILFSSDAFGSYGSVNEIFDDQISDAKQDFYIKEAERYYANIVAKFSRFVDRAIEKLGPLVPNISMIAPSHGIIWRSKMEKIINAYVRLAGYANGQSKCEPEVTVIWGSMYGFTKSVVTKVVEGLHREGVRVHIYQVPNDSAGFILGSAWRSAGLVIAMPTYEYRMFPPMAHMIDDFDRKEVKNRKVLRVGAFGWSGGAQQEFDEVTKNLNWECLPPVEWQGHADDEVLKRAFESAKDLARQVKEVAKK